MCAERRSPSPALSANAGRQRHWKLAALACICLAALPALAGDPLPGPNPQAPATTSRLATGILVLAALGSVAAALMIVRRNARERAHLESRHNDDLAQLTAANHKLRATLTLAADTAARSNSANETKSAFLANMSHEIRTPLTAILGYVELLAEGYAGHCEIGRKNAQAHINIIARNAEHLLRVINDILDLSKIEAGRLEVEHVGFSPLSVVGEVHDLLNVRAEAKRLPFNVEIEGTIPVQINGDPTRLRQILLNLLANAIKFTRDGRIRLVVRYQPDEPSNPRRGGTMGFDVIDTGIGITPEEIATLFQPFVQAQASTTRTFGGTGLGLTISQRLAELLGGTITVTSEPGAGSTFHLSIATGTLDDVNMTAESPANGNMAPNAPNAPAPLPTLSGRVLVAEDSRDSQRLVEHILSKVGLNVALASNGQEAVDAAQTALENGQPFDIILMDMQMSVLDGYDATRTLRARGYDLPIIALTAFAMPADREKCLAAGCDDYAAKPINRRELIATIQRHLQVCSEFTPA